MSKTLRILIDRGSNDILDRSLRWEARENRVDRFSILICPKDWMERYGFGVMAGEKGLELV